jgi:V/A-type H+-transporting ATPase subunit E
MSDTRMGDAIASETDNISGLEAALVERAQKLAKEQLAGGHQARERILAETRQRLHIEEEREVLAAKAQAGRAYQQRVQAAELDLRADLDRLRWELVHTVLAKLPARLEELTADEPCYLPLLLAYLREGAQAIECDELVAHLNQPDWQRFRHDWEKLARQAAPGKRLTLSPETLNSTGGVLVASTDGNIRFDNTFEGRMERLGEALQGTVAERFEPSPSPLPSPARGEGDRVSLRDAPVKEKPHG